LVEYPVFFKTSCFLANIAGRVGLNPDKCKVTSEWSVYGTSDIHIQGAVVQVVDDV